MREDASPEYLRDAVAQHQFHALPHDQQVQAIRRLSLLGRVEDSIARATGLAIQQIRTILGEEDRA